MTTQPLSPSTLEVIRPSPQVAEVWLNRPALRNAFNEHMIAELADCFARLGDDPHLRVVVLGGRGKSFCAGADLNWMRAMADFSWDQNRADAQALADMLWTVSECPLPVIGRIHGDCYAGGVGLAAVCDILVAAEPVEFCLSEARLGLLPATIAPYVVRAHRRAGGAALLHDCRALRRGRGTAPGLRAPGLPGRAARRAGRPAGRDAGRQRPGRGPRVQAAGQGCRRCADQRRAAQRDGAPHRRHPQQHGGP